MKGAEPLVIRADYHLSFQQIFSGAMGSELRKLTVLAVALRRLTILITRRSSSIGLADAQRGLNRVSISQGVTATGG
jgi:hypothetical protein